MYWLGTYLVISAIAAMGAFVFGDWVRNSHVDWPPRPGVAAVVAGILWPLVIVGLVQFAMVFAIARFARTYHWYGGIIPARRRPEVPVRR